MSSKGFPFQLINISTPTIYYPFQLIDLLILTFHLSHLTSLLILNINRPRLQTQHLFRRHDTAAGLPEVVLVKQLETSKLNRLPVNERLVGSDLPGLGTPAIHIHHDLYLRL